MAKFYGVATHEHYEKDAEDLTKLDKVVVGIGLGCFGAAFVFIFLDYIGLAIVMFGVFFCMIHLMAYVAFRAKSAALLVFDAIGVAAIIAGVLLMAGLTTIFEYYLTFGLALGFILAGCVTLFIFIRDSRKRKAYSLSVEAVCEIVDSRRLNVFNSVNGTNSYSPVEMSTIYKPGFHYVVNGQEYFTESTVYYGDLNDGFQEGNHVMLRVNPNQPNEVLPANLKLTGELMELVIGFGLLLPGIAMVVFTILRLCGMDIQI